MGWEKQRAAPIDKSEPPVDYRIDLPLTGRLAAGESVVRDPAAIWVSSITPPLSVYTSVLLSSRYTLVFHAGQ